jgi:hypothetical protein
MTLLPRSLGSTLVLWLNQETVHLLHLAVLATMRPTLDPAGHRVPQTKPTCLLHTWRPHRRRPFALVLHLDQHQSSCNLHLQYLAKNQSTQHCQSLITPGRDHPPVLEPHMVLTSSSHGHAIAADRVLPTQALRSHHVSAGIKSSRCARIPSPPAEPPVMVLWLNQVTPWFCGKPPQTPHADSGREPLPCTGSCPRLRLAFVATMRPTLDPAGHRVPQANPTCLSTPRRPCKA